MTNTPYRIGVISDTHGKLVPAVFTIFDGVDLIVHAGDIGPEHLLIELEAIAPVQAVNGNCDGPPDPKLRPLFRTLQTPAGRIAMTHGHLIEAPSTDRGRLASYFAEFKPDIVIYGHSHIPKLEDCGGVRVFNPGSAGDPRFGHPASLGLITANPQGPAIIEHRPLAVREAL